MGNPLIVQGSGGCRCRQKGEEDEAKLLCQEAVTASKEVLGAEHPHTQQFMRDLAVMQGSA